MRLKLSTRDFLPSYYTMTKLLISLDSSHEVHGVIGDSPVAFLRIAAIIDAGASAIIWAPNKQNFTPIINQYVDDGRLQFIESNYDFDILAAQIVLVGRAEVGGIIERLFVTLPASFDSVIQHIYHFCRKNRIPVHTADCAQYSSFSLLSTYSSGDFHMGISTSGKGCKLASRLKRELVSALPSNIDQICKTVGELRQQIHQEDNIYSKQAVGDLDDDAITTSTLNSLVEEFNMTQEQRKLQRNRWLSQIVEYYPLNKLADININDLTSSYKNKIASEELITKENDKKGSISLIGSGPGSVSLLTLGAFQAIFDADLILADKLVPQQVIDLIPQHRTKLFIARKFPGNAEAAQQELLTLGMEALTRGEKVVRLKQGDPYIFGRGGEEYNFFKQHGYTPTVVPGLTSALAAPVVANIPVTHRDVADQVLICTGTGRRGAIPNLPEFNKSRTTVFLMALHRIIEVIPKLIEEKKWDADLPVAIIERASSPDQRIIRTTLSKVAEAVAACGSRPPGLLVAGYACEVIEKRTNSAITVTDSLSTSIPIEPANIATPSIPTTLTSHPTCGWTVEEGFTQPDLLSLLSMIQPAQ